MAVTKILARKGRLDKAIRYVLNGDKTNEQILTARFNCEPGWELKQMLDTKREYGKTDGVQYYHIIQAFKPGEIEPEQALEIAKAFVEEYLSGYEVVIGTHIDKEHCHSHILFNSVNAETGNKYHSSPRTYYSQIRRISDRLCRERGLSVITLGERTNGKSVSYAEWLRQSRGQPTFRSMLEADLRQCIEAANDLGHFFMLMEHQGYEIKHGRRLGLRLRGEERFRYPGRKNPLFTEAGIEAAIQGNLETIMVGKKPVFVMPAKYKPYKRPLKYSGFLALYAHYLYILGKVEKRTAPPRLTPQLKKEVMRFERYKQQFTFLEAKGITNKTELSELKNANEAKLAELLKDRTLLNVMKKRRQPLYKALADLAVYAPARDLYLQGQSGLEAEYEKYTQAEALISKCSKSPVQLTAEKAAIYKAVAEINQEIQALRREIILCEEVAVKAPKIQKTIEAVEQRKVEQRKVEQARETEVR